MKKRIFGSLILMGLAVIPFSIKAQEMPAVYRQTNVNTSNYKDVTNDPLIISALDGMIGTKGAFSREAILGNNVSGRPMKIKFKNLAGIDKMYADYDALGWKDGKQLYIYINETHKNSPAEAISSLLSHEALHQDSFDSINEETYATTMEATVWDELTKRNPSLMQITNCSLVKRENSLVKMLKAANYTDKNIKNSVYYNPGYQALPETSPGFEGHN